MKPIRDLYTSLHIKLIVKENMQAFCATNFQIVACSDKHSNDEIFYEFENFVYSLLSNNRSALNKRSGRKFFVCQ